jgi:hypothetical protein
MHKKKGGAITDPASPLGCVREESSIFALRQEVFTIEANPSTHWIECKGILS